MVGVLASPQMQVKEWTWTELKKRNPISKQFPAQRRNMMERTKTQRFIRVARVKQALERAVESDKPGGNGKHVRPRKAMDSYGSIACMQGLSFTYLYFANTGEVGHGSEVREGVVWRWGEGEPILGFLLKLFWVKCPAVMTSHPKVVNMS